MALSAAILKRGLSGRWSEQMGNVPNVNVPRNKNGHLIRFLEHSRFTGNKVCGNRLLCATRSRCAQTGPHVV